MKLKLAAVLSCIVLSAAFTGGFSASAADNALGDVNGDGMVDSSDATKILMEYSALSVKGGSTLSSAQKKAADADKNGRIDASDSSLVMQYYAYLSTGKSGSLEYFSMSSRSGVSESQYRAASIDEMVRQFNKERSTFGAPPLKVLPYLCDIADIRAGELYKGFSHTRPNGTQVFDMIDERKAPFMYAAENIAMCDKNVDTAFKLWVDSPSHHNAMIRRESTHVGIGLRPDPNVNGRWYWAAVFIECGSSLSGEYIP